MALPEGEGSRNSQWLRRMVFTSNRNLTQSEAYLVAAPTSDGPSAAASQVSDHGSERSTRSGAQKMP